MRPFLRVAPILIASASLVGISPSPQAEEPAKSIKVPHLYDECHLKELKEDPNKLLEKSRILCGIISLTDVDHKHSENTVDRNPRRSVSITEVGDRLNDLKEESADVYLPRRHVATDAILKACERGNESTSSARLVRLEVTPAVDDSGRALKWNQFELVDVQFFNSTDGTWLPWIAKSENEARRKKKFTREIREKLMKLDKENAAEARKAAKPQRSDSDHAEIELRLALKSLATDRSAGQRMLKEIVDHYPGTSAASTAKAILEDEK